MLTHTTAWDQGDDETLKLVLVYVAWLLISLICLNVHNSASPYLMDLRGLMVTKNAYFSLLTHIKQLLLVTLCDTTAGIGNSKVGLTMPPPLYGHTDVKVEIGS